MAVPRPTKLAIPTHDIEDLVLRIRATRWPDQLEGVEWQYGTELSYVKARFTLTYRLLISCKPIRSHFY